MNGRLRIILTDGNQCSVSLRDAHTLGAPGRGLALWTLHGYDITLHGNFYALRDCNRFFTNSRHCFSLSLKWLGSDQLSAISSQLSAFSLLKSLSASVFQSPTSAPVV